jgi:hypothetical protein
VKHPSRRFHTFGRVGVRSSIVLVLVLDSFLQRLRRKIEDEDEHEDDWEPKPRDRR